MHTDILKVIQFETSDDLNTIQSEYHFPQQIIASLLDRAEIAHIYLDDSPQYLLLKFPHEPFESGNHVTRPIAIILQDSNIYFVAHKDIPLHAFIQEIHTHNSISPHHIISKFFLYMLNSFENILSNAEASIVDKEKQLFKKTKNETIENLLHVQKAMIHFKVAIVGFQNILHTITATKPAQLWDDSVTSEYAIITLETNQVATTIQVIDELIESTINVSDSIYANNLSRTMQTLTSITLVLSIPTLVASIYGMNIPLPLQDHPQGLLIVTATTFFLTLSVVIYLYRRDWF